jgi:translation initiation factor IF-2
VSLVPAARAAGAGRAAARPPGSPPRRSGRGSRGPASPPHTGWASRRRRPGPARRPATAPAGPPGPDRRRAGAAARAPRAGPAAARARLPAPARRAPVPAADRPPPAAGPPPGRRRLAFRPGAGQLLLHGGRAQAAEHRGLGDPQPAGDLAVRSPLRPPPGRLLPVACGQLAGPSPLAYQPGHPLAQCPVMQRRDVVLGQPHHRCDRPAAEPELAQHRHGHVPHPRVPGRVAGQQRRSGADERHAVMLVAAQVPGGEQAGCEPWQGTQAGGQAARWYSHAPSGANTMMIAAYQASESQT